MSNIILNEREWVEGVVSRFELGKKPIETISRIARWLYADGYRKDEIADYLANYLIKCDPSINTVKWQEVIDSVAKNAGKYQLINIDGIHITKSEMERLEVINGRMLQRLMFTLLCLAKYRNAVNPSNNSWVNYEAIQSFCKTKY